MRDPVHSKVWRDRMLRNRNVGFGCDCTHFTAPTIASQMVLGSCTLPPP
jgi:hypothetical protein